VVWSVLSQACVSKTVLVVVDAINNVCLFSVLQPVDLMPLCRMMTWVRGTCIQTRQLRYCGSTPKIVFNRTFFQWVCLMSNNIMNKGTLLTLWTAWWHYFPRKVLRFMHGCLFMVFEQWAQLSATLAICSQLEVQLVSRVLCLICVVCFRATCISVQHLL
jgi:hypothetical protein